MAQQSAWEREYQRPQLVTKDEEPQKYMRRFFKYLKKAGFVLEEKSVLDLGCGTGRNANYLASIGNTVIGIDISSTALTIGKNRAAEAGLSVDYREGSIGEPYAIDDASIDLVLDVTASNSLNEAERDVYLKEVHRVLKPGGYFFVRGLLKDGDKNAKALIAKHPGREKDTYINRDMQLTERVFSKEDFVALYGAYFDILSFDKTSSYTRFGGQSYKRNFFIAYLQKK